MKNTLLVVALVFITGCMSSQFHVHTKSISANTVPKFKTYSIRSVNGEKPTNSLRQAERLKLIKRVFSDSGFSEVSKNPMYTADITFGISDPKTKSGSTPIIGQTGVSSSTTYGNVSSYGNVNSYGNYNSYGTYNATTYNTPTFGVVGSRSYSYDEYTRYLIIKAYDPNGDQIFDTQSFSSGTSGDLDQVLPILCYQMIPFFGKTLKGTSKDIVFENSRAFKKWLQSTGEISSSEPIEVPTVAKKRDSKTEVKPLTFDEAKKDLFEQYRSRQISKEEYFKLYKELHKSYSD